MLEETLNKGVEEAPLFRQKELLEREQEKKGGGNPKSQNFETCGKSEADYLIVFLPAAFS